MSHSVSVRLAALLLLACSGRGPGPGGAARGAPPARAPALADPRDAALLARMTLEEKVAQLAMFGEGAPTGPDAGGHPRDKGLDELVREGLGSVLSFAGAARVNRLQRMAVTGSRLGIPLVFAGDVIHGWWTIFPVPLGVAATWDPEDAGRMARISGLEAYADGLRWTFAPMVDHPVDPRWGRVVETFGEAPLVASDAAVAAVRGFHGALAGRPELPAPADFGVAACLKHLVGYGAVQGGKDYAYVDLSERALRELHLPPFAAGIAAGARSIMPAFTTGLGGVPMTSNRRVLQDIVRGELGFSGVLVTDYAAITEMRAHGTAADDLDAAIRALRDGTITIDMVDGVYRAQLARAVRSGALREEQIDREVLRVLAFKRRLGLFEHPYVPEDLAARVRVTPAHVAAARAMAERSVVLMKNDAGLLPLARPRRILVVGPLAAAEDDLLGPWAGPGPGGPAAVKSVLEAIRERAAGEAAEGRAVPTVTSAEGCRLDAQGRGDQGDPARIAAAVAAARRADVVVAVLGERRDQSGEARNRSRLDLPGAQQELVDALAATGKPIVVVLLTGRPLAVPALVERAGALVHAFFPGMEGGTALARVLFGDVNPGGKQPITWPRSVGQLPIHHYDRPNGRPNVPEREDYKAFWLDEVDQPLFPFGHGLSYTRFELSDLEVPARVSRGEPSFVVRVRVRNVGDRTGSETPQLYVRPRVASTVTPSRLQGYRRVAIAPGESVVVDFRVPVERLAIYDPYDHPVVEPGTYDVVVGTSAAGGLRGSFRLER